MKKILVLGCTLFALMLMSASILKTQLHVTVLDDLGTFQEGAVVKLYADDADYAADKPAVEAQITDKKGRTRFIGVEAKEYFILVEKDGKNNVLGGERTGKLEEGRINKINVIISE